MPLTRASRKRVTAGVGAEGLENDSVHVQVPVPKAKRARTAQGKTTITTTATRKTRALKPLATNANATKNSNDDSTQQKQPAKARGRTAMKAANTTTKTMRGRKAEASTNDDESFNAALAAAEESTSSATLADDKPAGTAAASALSANDTNAVAAPAMTRPQIPTSSSFYENGTPDDIDAWDAHDPLQVTDYVADMYDHFRSKEEQCSVDSMYMGSAAHGKQPHINESMRCILVDWLIEVHYKFKLFPETLYLTVNVLDRFLAQTKEIVSKRDLQLVGVTALLVSAKYEEMYVPELRDLTYICDGAYTEAKVCLIVCDIIDRHKKGNNVQALSRLDWTSASPPFRHCIGRAIDTCSTFLSHKNSLFALDWFRFYGWKKRCSRLSTTM